MNPPDISPYFPICLIEEFAQSSRRRLFHKWFVDIEYVCEIDTTFPPGQRSLLISRLGVISSPQWFRRLLFGSSNVFGRDRPNQAVQDGLAWSIGFRFKVRRPQKCTGQCWEWIIGILCTRIPFLKITLP